MKKTPKTRSFSVSFSSTPYEIHHAQFHYGEYGEESVDISKPFCLTVVLNIEECPQNIKITIPMDSCLELLEKQHAPMV